MNKNYSFTKTSLISGFQCEKKLWFELHKKIKTGEKALFEAGNRFNDIVRKHYGQGLDLSKEFNYKKVIDQTQQAIESNNFQVIYEGGFQYQDTFIRSDVLIKNQDTWTMLEAKGSTSVKDINFLDVAIQSYVAKNAGLKIQTFKLIHINKEFIYQGDENYSDLIVEQDITEEVLNKESEIKDLIEKFKPLIKGNCPDIKVGPQCKNPYPCHYLDRCQPPETDIKNVSYTILPYHGKKIESYCQEHAIEKLKDVPRELLQSSRKDYAENYHYIIQQAHISNQPWINKDIKERFKDWTFPYYFMDFETVQQTVPIIKNTKPFEQLPFQWSVHKWSAKDQPLEEFSFLDFDHPDIEHHFLKQLVETLGDEGTIFVHNHPFEKGVLNRLKEKPNLTAFTKSVDNIIERIVDTLEITRKHFYSPEMFGKYSLKKIVKGIPTKVSYEDEDDTVNDGSAAQLAWFKATNPKTQSEEKEQLRQELIKYCAKDTYAMYDLILFYLNQGKV